MFFNFLAHYSNHQVLIWNKIVTACAHFYQIYAAFLCFEPILCIMNCFWRTKKISLHLPLLLCPMTLTRCTCKPLPYFSMYAFHARHPLLPLGAARGCQTVPHTKKSHFITVFWNAKSIVQSNNRHIWVLWAKIPALGAHSNTCFSFTFTAL